MTILDYKGDIHRDTNVFGDNVYTENGQGCGTVWFASVKQARQVIGRLGRAPKGHESGLCPKCSCYYSFGSKQYKQYPEFACREWKRSIAMARGR